MISNLELENLIKKLSIKSFIPRINSGGCGFFALEMYDFLLKKYKVKSNFFIITHDYRSKENYIDSTRKSNYLPKNSVHHIILEYNKIYFDSNRIFNNIKEIGYHSQIVVPISFTYVKKTVSIKYRWCEDFDRIKDLNLRLSKIKIAFL